MSGSPFELYAPDINSAFTTQDPLSGWTTYRVDPQDTKDFSLIFVLDRPRETVLLGLKKRGFGTGLYNGFGGKPEKHETMLDCAKRELEEESGLQVSRESLRPAGNLHIARPNGDSSSHSVINIHIYTCEEWNGTPVETEEMAPRWFPISEDSLPLSQMWPEASLFLIPLLSAAMSNTTKLLQAYDEYQIVRPNQVAPWQLLPRVPALLGVAADQALVGWVLSWIDGVDRVD